MSCSPIVAKNALTRKCRRYVSSAAASSKKSAVGFSFLFFCILLSILSLPTETFAVSTELEVRIAPSKPRVGDAIIVEVPRELGAVQSAYFGEWKLSIIPYRGSTRIVSAIPITSKPRRELLRIAFRNDRDLEKPVMVSRRDVQTIDLGIPPKLKMTPKGLTRSLASSKVSLESVFSTATEKFYVNAPFGLPLASNIDVRSDHGEIRRSGTELIRHLGVDFGAPLGAAVYAINSGVVRKNGTDPIYGLHVIVDHGYGIYSFYLHLSKINVHMGQFVRKGTRIGAVGESGYATGPHLHLTIKVNGTSVDPISFVKNFR